MTHRPSRSHALTRELRDVVFRGVDGFTEFSAAGEIRGCAAVGVGVGCGCGWGTGCGFSGVVAFAEEPEEDGEEGEGERDADCAADYYA
jgi:hypothetical protein